MKKNKIIAMVVAGVVFIIALINPFKKNGDVINEDDFKTVVIVTEKINSKNKITKEDIKTKKIHKDAIINGAFSKIEDVEGKITNSTLYPGDIISKDKVEEAGSKNAGLSSGINNSERAITINVEPSTGIANLLNIGDEVDLVVVASGDDGKVFGNILAQKRKILALGNKSSSGDENTEESNTYDTVTIAVTPGEAVKIALAENIGQELRVILRNKEDEQLINDIDKKIEQGEILK